MSNPNNKHKPVPKSLLALDSFTDEDLELFYPDNWSYHQKEIKAFRESRRQHRYLQNKAGQNRAGKNTPSSTDKKAS